MKRLAFIAAVMLTGLGAGAVLAAPTGINRVVLAKGAAGDISIEAKGPVQVTHAVVSLDAGGTSDWISWPGTLVATLKTGELSYRNASNDGCAPRTWVAGEAIVIPGDTVFEAANGGEVTAELHTVGFFPPGAKPSIAGKPANC